MALCEMSFQHVRFFLMEDPKHKNYHKCNSD